MWQNMSGIPVIALWLATARKGPAGSSASISVSQRKYPS